MPTATDPVHQNFCCARCSHLLPVGRPAGAAPKSRRADPSPCRLLTAGRKGRRRRQQFAPTPLSCSEEAATGGARRLGSMSLGRILDGSRSSAHPAAPTGCPRPYRTLRRPSRKPQLAEQQSRPLAHRSSGPLARLASARLGGRLLPWLPDASQQAPLSSTTPSRPRRLAPGGPTRGPAAGAMLQQSYGSSATGGLGGGPEVGQWRRGLWPDGGHR